MRVICRSCGHEADFPCYRGARLSDHACQCGGAFRRAVSGPPRGSLGTRVECALCGRRRMTGGQWAKQLAVDSLLMLYDGRPRSDSPLLPAGAWICWSHSTTPADPAVRAAQREALGVRTEDAR